MATISQKNNPCQVNIPDREILIDSVEERQNYTCFVCGPDCLGTSALAPHHIIHNTMANRILYPLLIHHRINIILVCQNCHRDIDRLTDSVTYHKAETYNDLLAAGWQPLFHYIIDYRGGDDEEL